MKPVAFVSSALARVRAIAFTLILASAACAALPPIDSAAQAATRTPTVGDRQRRGGARDGAARRQRLGRQKRPARDPAPPASRSKRRSAASLAVEEAISRQPLLLGNRVDLHFDGPATYAAMFKAIRAARGVDVKLILPSYSDSGLVFHAGRSHYTGLLRAGVKVYERRNAMLHAKTAVIDGVWSTVGSTNLDLRSFLHNDEVNATILGTDFVRRMDAMFKRDLAESQAIALGRWRERPILQRMKELGSRLFSYWL